MLWLTAKYGSFRSSRQLDPQCSGHVLQAWQVMSQRVMYSAVCLIAVWGMQVRMRPINNAAEASQVAAEITRMQAMLCQLEAVLQQQCMQTLQDSLLGTEAGV